MKTQPSPRRDRPVAAFCFCAMPLSSFSSRACEKTCGPLLAYAQEGMGLPRVRTRTSMSERAFAPQRTRGQSARAGLCATRAALAVHPPFLSRNPEIPTIREHAARAQYLARRAMADATKAIDWPDDRTCLAGRPALTPCAKHARFRISPARSAPLARFHVRIRRGWAIINGRPAIGSRFMGTGRVRTRPQPPAFLATRKGTT
jgi:hypothetical protein